MQEWPGQHKTTNSSTKKHFVELPNHHWAAHQPHFQYLNRVPPPKSIWSRNMVKHLEATVQKKTHPYWFWPSRINSSVFPSPFQADILHKEPGKFSAEGDLRLTESAIFWYSAVSWYSFAALFFLPLLHQNVKPPGIRLPNITPWLHLEVSRANFRDVNPQVPCVWTHIELDKEKSHKMSTLKWLALISS